MALVRAGENSVPIMFLVEESGYTIVNAFRLSIRFSLSENLVHIDEEVFDVDNGELTHTLGQVPVFGISREWHLKLGRYFAYGLTDCFAAESNQGVTIRVSSTNTPHTPTPIGMPVSVKIEPGCKVIALGSDDLDDSSPPYKIMKRTSTLVTATNQIGG